MRELLGGDDGALTVGDVAKLLDISRQAIDKRRKAGRLLGVEVAKRGVLYPAWQFIETGTVAGLAEVLALLQEHDSWAQARFFVTENDRLGGKRPLDLLRRGKRERVLDAARVFGEHAAGRTDERSGPAFDRSRAGVLTRSGRTRVVPQSKSVGRFGCS